LPEGNEVYLKKQSNGSCLPGRNKIPRSKTMDANHYAMKFGENPCYVRRRL